MAQIFGHDWSDIQRAQQGGRLSKSIDTSEPIDNSPSQQDLDLLAQHGAEGLERLGYHGTIDRLRRNGYINA